MTPWTLITTKSVAEAIQTTNVSVQLPKGQRRRVQKFEFHPYDAVAILFLKRPAPLNSKVICSWRPDWINQSFPTQVNIVSYCVKNEEIDRQIQKDLPIINHNQCQKKLLSNRTLHSGEFCIDVQDNFVEDECQREPMLIILTICKGTFAPVAESVMTSLEFEKYGQSANKLISSYCTKS